MEKRIRAYEKFIKAEAKKELSASEREKLINLNREMIQNFQHERLIHLIIMLFFVAMSLGLIAGFAWTLCEFGLMAEMSAFYALAGIVVILTICYVKHYYFLENHVQKLYDVTEELYK